ncbi:annexin A7-like isoform X1 [Pomacea canaliculata]|uniref:annexin A7-like isoform X1 n=1 Tax=Pomacea canaliculata TaxID=400727 RepID=UPI000D73FAA7|nr:annexin A7-like isoform X1 [Pomacea canaliculata]XP_025079130.1 annexin A7-like isoform X1 [Pomacea canaliculata]
MAGKQDMPPPYTQGAPGGYPPQQGGYPPQQAGYPPQQAGYPPPQAGYPPPQGYYPPQQQGYMGQAPVYYPPQPVIAAPAMQSTTSNNVVVVNSGQPAVQTVVVERRGVNHVLHFIISLFFWPWIIVWIILCIVEGC